MEKTQNLSNIAAELIIQAKNLQCLANQLAKMMDKINKRDHGLKITGDQSNIISFSRAAASAAQAPILAIPGKSLPRGIYDYRPLLQRDGLILLAWDKRMTETGERYTAYWVTSTGICRFYASMPLSSKNFASARPDHKSYAAEDGIEFYGQEAPDYMVHIAPELMKSNPRHMELRLNHINVLKQQGSEVDFNYKFLLKTEKNRNLPPKKTKSDHHHRAGA